MDKNHADCHQCLSVNGSPQAKKHSSTLILYFGLLSYKVGRVQVTASNRLYMLTKFSEF